MNTEARTRIAAIARAAVQHNYDGVLELEYALDSAEETFRNTYPDLAFLSGAMAYFASVYAHEFERRGN